MHNIFETREDGSIKVIKDCTLFLHEKNINVLPNGNLDTLLFGSLLLAHDPNKNDNVYYTIKLPVRVELEIYSPDQYRIDEEKYYIIYFFEGDTIIKNNIVPASAQNVSDILDMVLGGQLSNLIPYYEYYGIIMKAMEYNQKINFPKVLLEILLAESFLDNSKKQSVRFTAGKENGIPISIKNSVLNKNTFNSMTFEDWSKSAFINKKKSIKQQTQEPSVLETYMRK